MSKNNLFKKLCDTTSKHAPEIFMGLGIAGMGTAIVLAITETPKALKAIDAKKEEIFNDLPDEEVEETNDPYEVKLSTKDIVKTTWKYYVPTASLFVISTVCLIGSNKISNKRSLVFATAYKLSEKGFAEYREKVIDTIGEKKEKAIRDSIAKDKVDEKPFNPVETKTVIIDNGQTKYPYRDGVFGTDFMSNSIIVDKAINKINAKLISQDYVPLNDFYEELGLDSIDIGYELGWNIGRDGLVEIEKTPITDSNGEAIMVLSYRVEPRYEYDKYYI